MEPRIAATQRRILLRMHAEIIVIAWITMLVLEATSASAGMDTREILTLDAKVSDFMYVLVF